MQCKNCEFDFKGNYCPECGQKATISRFDFAFFVRKFFDSFDLDQGFFYTIGVLVYKPGSSIRKYIEGERINYYNPLKLLLITGAISTFLIFQFKLFSEIALPEMLKEYLPGWEEYNYYSAKYFSFFTIVAIPLFALSSWLTFLNKGFNYMENLVLNIYIASGQFLIICFYSVVIIYFPGDLTINIYAILNFGYNVWVLVYFFNAFSVKGKVKSIAAVVIPQISVVYINYLFFRMAPEEIWNYLELVFN